MKPAAITLCLVVTLNLFAKTLIPYRCGELWGYCTPNKKIVIEPKYERAGWFSDGLALVAKGCDADCYDQYDGKWGYIDTKGREVIPFQYDEAFRFINGKTYARQGESWFELNTKGVHVLKLDEAPYSTVHEFEQYLAYDVPKGYYMMEFDYYLGNMNSKGYVNKKGKQFWSDPEKIFFFGLETEDFLENDEISDIKLSHPLLKQLKHKLSEQKPPLLISIRFDGEKINVEKGFELIEDMTPDGADGEMVFLIRDYHGLKQYLSQLDQNVKDYKFVLAYYVQVPSESMEQNIFFNLLRFDIQFVDVIYEHKMISFHTSLYEFNTEYTRNAILNDMLKDLHITGRAMKEQGDSQNIKIEGAENPYAGKMLFDVMEQAVLDDVWQFLRYVQARPFIYIGGRWKFAEAFATWVAFGAPRLVEKEVIKK
jgi:hypothetical protein